MDGGSMNDRGTTSHTGPVARTARNPWLAKSAAALLLGLALGQAALVSCTTTGNKDGSFTLTISPDMTITAWGLEEAARQLLDMKKHCLAGTWKRKCTAQENESIDKCFKEVLEVKKSLKKTGPHIGAGLTG